MTLLTVGSGQDFATIAAAIAAARDGDVVEVQAGTYVNDFADINVDVTLRAVGGTAELIATAPPPKGKAILNTTADVTIDGFAFSGAAVPDQNGAGIRHQGGALTVLNSRFEDNENGILSGYDPAATLTIRNSEFAANGNGTGYTHNLYVGDIARLVVEDSVFRDADAGHQIKSRAQETVITGSPSSRTTTAARATAWTCRTAAVRCWRATSSSRGRTARTSRWSPSVSKAASTRDRAWSCAATRW